MEQPLGFVALGMSGRSLYAWCHLHKWLYGLKQFCSTWFNRL